VLEGDQAHCLKGFPGAAFIVGMREGFRLADGLEGPVVKPGAPGGTHGFLPNTQAMDASFFLVGPGVPGGRNLGRIDMRDIAPTLANLLGLSLPSAEGRSIISPVISP
jgi:hypothetical protein